MDVCQHGTSSDVQSYLSLVEFECFQQVRKDAVRDKYKVTPSANPTDGLTLNLGGTVYTWRNSPNSPTDIQIGSTVSASCSNAVAVIGATGNPQGVRATVKTSTYFELHFDKNALLTKTLTLGSGWGSVSTGRLTGGMQGYYNDDIHATLGSGQPGRIDQTVICCMLATMGTGSTQYSGSAVMDRCTFARFAESATLAASGFDGVQDDEPMITSNAASSAPASDHVIRSSVLTGMKQGSGGAIVADGTYVNGAVTTIMANNRYPKWALAGVGGARADAMLAGNGKFGLDAQGKTKYTIQNDGLNSQAAFRSEMYAVLKLADVTDRASIGVTDPATWV
jgi:hypothetical protein